MIGIVDSGSTKTSWVFVDKAEAKISCKTVGINPFYQSKESILEVIEKELIPQLPKDIDIEKIYYYGAGCEQEDQKASVRWVLNQKFPKTESDIGHDLLAAARALLGDQEGIACISGTGSNSCYYDGIKIVKNIFSLGLSLGDEGSGGYKGRMLVRDYIREAMPSPIREKFELFTPDRKREMLDKVYNKPFPNRYLASFARFAIENKEDQYIHQLVYESYRQMFEQSICRYERHKELPINYIGSVAAYLRPILEEVARSKGARIGTVIANPMDALSEYHLKRI
jgi:glucosamine kinase